ncbi:hypothetical protein GE09DRAFT_1294199 [Coniochaeta sp. 2T2.1]|nr:hypothetical protein GE09DRAFT_1294199 [Coniochaeta sp. 2T2.1]
MSNTDNGASDINEGQYESHKHPATAFRPASATTLSQMPASNPQASSMPLDSAGHPANTQFGGSSREYLAAPRPPPSIQRHWMQTPARTEGQIYTSPSVLMPPPATIPHHNQAGTAIYHQNSAMGQQAHNPPHPRPMAQPTRMPQQQDAPEQVGMTANVTRHADQILGAYRALPSACSADQRPQATGAQLPQAQSTGTGYINTSLSGQNNQFFASNTSSTQTLFPCNLCFQNFATQLHLRVHEKETHEIWWCTVPGCKRDKPLVNKHPVARHVHDIHEKAQKPVKPTPKVPTAEEDAAAMASYLSGHDPQHPAGPGLAPRKRQRTEDSPTGRDSKGDTERILNLEAENARLNGLLRKLAEEVKTIRAEAEAKE